MMKFIIFLAVILILYYYLRKLFSPCTRGTFRSPGAGRGASGNRPPPVTDELVQDPVCKAYCPKREAKSMVYKGKKYYFCSMECLDKFRKQHG